MNLREMTADIPERLIAIRNRERETKSLRITEPQAAAESIHQGYMASQKSVYVLRIPKVTIYFLSYRYRSK